MFSKSLYKDSLSLLSKKEVFFKNSFYKFFLNIIRFWHIQSFL